MSARAKIRLTWLATAVYWFVLAVMTHIPRGKGPDLGTHDKLAHLGAYGVLTGALFCSLWIWRPRDWSALWRVPMIVLAYGAIDEWTQAIPGINRSCESADWLADATGMLIALAILSLVRRAVQRARAGGASDATSGS